MNIAVIGLGRMGTPIAAHIRQAYPEASLRLHDTEPAQVSAFVAEHGGESASSAKTVAGKCEFIVTSLPADKELRAVAEQIVPTLSPQTIWIDHSTTSATAARELADQLSQIDAHFLDAPVSGGVEGAQRGTLTIMVGGDQTAFEKAMPLIKNYAARVNHMGDSGAGQTTKMANQICQLGICQSLAESLDFAQRSGLDPEKVAQVMLQGAAASWQMENRTQPMLAGEYDFGFSTQLMRKDVGLVLEEAHTMNAALPATELVSRLLDEVDAMGGANWDWCSLMERQRRS